MRSLFKKSLAFCLVLALALSCFVGAITVNAETYNATISISAESLDSVPVTDTVVPVTLTINSDVAINVARLALSLTGGLRFNANPVVESEEYEINEISDDYSLFFVEAIDGEEDGNTVVGGYTNATVTLSVLVPAFTTPGTYAINVVTSGVNASTPNEEDVNLVYDGSGAILIATDAEVPVIVVNNNPVVVNGSAQGISTANSDLVDTNAPDNFSVAHGNKYVVTYLGGLNATDDTMYDFYMNNSAEQIALNDPYAVNGLSFKLKVNGQLPKFGIYLDDSGSNWYEGEIKAYDAYGTLVATKEANEGWFFNGTLPEDFEGTIIIDNTNYRTENGKITFAQFYNEYGFTGVTLAAAIPHDAVDGDLLMEYDDLRLISDDLDTYVNSLVYCRHLNTTESEEITLAPTCIEAGTKTVTVTCDDCGEVVSATAIIEIPRTGAHKYSPDVCSVCGAINPEVPVIPVKGNPVIINGSVQGISERTSNAGTNSPDNFDVAYGEKYVVTYKGGIDASKDAMFDFFLYYGNKKLTLDNPSAVKGLSFKLKVNGKLPKFGMYHDDNGTCYYRGEIWAYDTQGNLVATKPNGDPFIFKNTLPEDFEGTIVIGVDNNKIHGGSGTFADHYAQHGLRGLKLAAAIPHDAVAGDFFMEYDDLRLITDDLDTYKASLAAPAACEHANKSADWIIETVPTATTVGSKHKLCADCGEKVDVTEMPTTETEYVAFSNQRYNPAIEGIELIYSYGNDSDFRAILRHANSTGTRKLAYVIKIGEKEYDFKMDTIGSGRQIITGGFSLQDISSDVALFIRVTWTEDGVEKVFESNPYVDRYDELLEENIAAGAFSADELEVVNAYKALVTAANAATTAMDVTTVNAESGYITYSAAKYTASLSSVGFVYDYSASSFKADVLDVAKATGTRKMYYIIDINGKEYDFEMTSIGSGRQIITGGLSVSDLANAKFFIRIAWTDPVEGAKVVDTNAVSINAAADLAAADTELADAYNAYIAAIS